MSYPQPFTSEIPAIRFYGKWNVGKCIEKPRKLFVKALPTSLMALHPETENIKKTIRHKRYQSLLTISPPCLAFIIIITEYSTKD